MRKFNLLTTLFLLIGAFLMAEGEPELDPAALKTNWWEQISESPGTAAEKAATIEQQIKIALNDMSEEKKPEAEEAFRQVSLNFKTYLKTSDSPPIALPQATPLAANYPVSEALDIARIEREKTLELKSLKEERQDLLTQIDLNQEQLDRQIKSYSKESDRSEERFIKGLKLINARLILLTSKLELERVNKGITGFETFLKLNQEELAQAQQRLVSDKETITGLEKKQESAHAVWQESVRAFNEKEKERVDLSSRFEGENGSANLQLYDQELMQATIREMSDHQAYLESQFELALARILYDPDSIEALALSKQSRDWAKRITNLSRRSEELRHTAERQIQRTGQMLSLKSQAEDEKTANRALQQQILQMAQTNLLALQRLDSQIEDTQFLQSQLESRTNAQLGKANQFFNEASLFFRSIGSSASDWIESPLFHVGNLPVSLSTLLKFLLTLLITVWGSKKLTDGISKIALTRKSIDKSVLYRINRLAYYFLLSLGFLIALAVVGFDFSSFLLIAGALGVGLGFGLQAIFNNFMSGLILLFESHIKVGDYIEIASGVRGEVKEINVRSTIVAQSSGVDMIIPNAEMISSRVTNWTLSHPYHRIKIPFTVSYSSDKEQVRKVVTEAALKVPDTLIKPGYADPAVFLTGFGPLGLDFELYVWLNEKNSRMPGKSLSDYLWVIEETLKANKIEMPFPRTDIRLI